VTTDVSRADRLPRAALDALPDATAVVDARGVIIATNAAWDRFAADNGGTPESTGAGVNYLAVCDAAMACTEARLVATALRRLLAGELGGYELEYPCPSPAEPRWFVLRIAPLGLPGGGAVLSHVDITRRKLVEDALAYEARHDALTGLANRVELELQLRTALIRPDRSGVVYVDLDGFKGVNDTYGHRAGDELLREAAARLQAAVRQGDAVARMGGDEFVVLARDVDAVLLDRLAERLRGELARPYRVAGHTVSVGASVGVHLLAAAQSIDEALHAADTAMYRAKSRRGHTA
jgi:diguanylate cyclase (GGDEF)-like protein